MASMALGYCVVLTANLLSYPIDTVRRLRYLTKRLRRLEVRYKGSIDCVRQIVSKEGSKALMKGFGTKTLKASSS